MLYVLCTHRKCITFGVFNRRNFFKDSNNKKIIIKSNFLIRWPLCSFTLQNSLERNSPHNKMFFFSIFTLINLQQTHTHTCRDRELEKKVSFVCWLIRNNYQSILKNWCIAIVSCLRVRYLSSKTTKKNCCDSIARGRENKKRGVFSFASKFSAISNISKIMNAKRKNK